MRPPRDPVRNDLRTVSVDSGLIGLENAWVAIGEAGSAQIS
jgi:hypothetical protein